MEVSSSHTVHTRITDRTKHEATPTASALSSGPPPVIHFTIVDRILVRVCPKREKKEKDEKMVVDVGWLTPCPLCFTSSRYIIESTGTLPNWWVWSTDEAPPTELHSRAAFTHCQSCEIVRLHMEQGRKDGTHLHHSRESFGSKFRRSKVVHWHLLVSGTGMERRGTDHGPVALGSRLVDSHCQQSSQQTLVRGIQL